MKGGSGGERPRLLLSSQVLYFITHCGLHLNIFTHHQQYEEIHYFTIIYEVCIRIILRFQSDIAWSTSTHTDKKESISVYCVYIWYVWMYLPKHLLSNSRFRNVSRESK
jgi:Ca2+/Na+ antiporter